jgi:hypothetical protein
MNLWSRSVSSATDSRDAARNGLGLMDTLIARGAGRVRVISRRGARRERCAHPARPRAARRHFRAKIMANNTYRHPR